MQIAHSSRCRLVDKMDLSCFVSVVKPIIQGRLPWLEAADRLTDALLVLGCAGCTTDGKATAVRRHMSVFETLFGSSDKRAFAVISQ
jgi:hypothetical protein